MAIKCVKCGKYGSKVPKDACIFQAASKTLDGIYIYGIYYIFGKVCEAVNWWLFP